MFSYVLQITMFSNKKNSTHVPMLFILCIILSICLAKSSKWYGAMKLAPCGCPFLVATSIYLYLVCLNLQILIIIKEIVELGVIFLLVLFQILFLGVPFFYASHQH